MSKSVKKKIQITEEQLAQLEEVIDGVDDSNYGSLRHLNDLEDSLEWILNIQKVDKQLWNKLNGKDRDLIRSLCSNFSNFKKSFEKLGQFKVKDYTDESTPKLKWNKLDYNAACVLKGKKIYLIENEACYEYEIKSKGYTLNKFIKDWKSGEYLESNEISEISKDDFDKDYSLEGQEAYCEQNYIG